MASITKSQLLTKLNTRLRDGGNTTWSAAEKNEILSQAINDPYVYIVDRDDTTTTTANTATYPSPFQEIYDMYIDINDDTFPMHIPRSNYDIVNGNIYMDRSMRSLATGHSLIIYGKKKLTDSDLYPDIVQDYILEMAMVGAFEMLKTSLTSRFVKNDITMAEVIQSINTHRQEAARLRQGIINQRLVTL